MCLLGFLICSLSVHFAFILFSHSIMDRSGSVTGPWWMPLAPESVMSIESLLLSPIRVWEILWAG